MPTDTLPTPFGAEDAVERLPHAYRQMLAGDGHQHPEAFAYMLSRLFAGIDLHGLRVLEVGSGRGILSAYMGLQGAHVLSMEPEGVGSTVGVIAEQQRRLAALGLRTVDVINADFNTWNAGPEKFELIVLRASINHLYPSDKHADADPATRAAYLNVIQRLHGLLSRGGRVVATDASRYAFFSMLAGWGVRRPWHRRPMGVNWRHHQNPGTWAALFREVGFREVTINYPVAYRLRALAPLANTAAANFFLKGAFILTATE